MTRPMRGDGGGGDGARTAVLLKPFDPAELVAAVAGLIVEAERGPPAAPARALGCVGC